MGDHLRAASSVHNLGPVFQTKLEFSKFYENSMRCNRNLDKQSVDRDSGNANQA